MRRCFCGAMAVWCHPTDKTWTCELHAPPVRDRGRCVACGAMAAWRHPSDGWLCLAHASSEVS